MSETEGKQRLALLTTSQGPLIQTTATKEGIELFEKVKNLKKGMKVSSNVQVINRLVDYWIASHLEQSGGKTIGTFENIMSVPAPVCLYGLPGSGKSYTLNKFCQEAAGKGSNVLLIDTVNEHLNLGFKKKQIAYSINWTPRKGLYRIVPDKDMRNRIFNVKRLFEHLSMLEVKGKLLDWTIGIDEGNQFVNLQPLRDFLIESRKFTKKVVIISAQPGLFANICTPMTPLPRIKG